MRRSVVLALSAIALQLGGAAAVSASSTSADQPSAPCDGLWLNPAPAQLSGGDADGRRSLLATVPRVLAGVRLPASAFAATSDGAALPVAVAPVAAEDTSVVVVLDLDAGTARTVDAVRAAAMELVVQIPAGVRVGLVRAAGRPAVVVPPTASRQRVSDAIQAEKSAPRADLDAAAQLAADVPRRPRRHVVVLTNRTGTAEQVPVLRQPAGSAAALHVVEVGGTTAEAVPLAAGCSQRVALEGLVAAVDSVVSRVAGEYVVSVPADRRDMVTVSVDHAATEALAAAAPEAVSSAAGGTGFGGAPGAAPSSASASGGRAIVAPRPVAVGTSSPASDPGPRREILVLTLLLCSLPAAFLGVRRLVAVLRRRRAAASEASSPDKAVPSAEPSAAHSVRLVDAHPVDPIDATAAVESPARVNGHDRAAVEGVPGPREAARVPALAAVGAARGDEVRARVTPPAPRPPVSPGTRSGERPPVLPSPPSSAAGRVAPSAGPAGGRPVSLPEGPLTAPVTGTQPPSLPQEPFAARNSDADSPAHGGDPLLDAFADELAAGADVATALRSLAERSRRRPAAALRRLATQVESGDPSAALRAARTGRRDERWRWAAVALEVAGTEQVPAGRVVRRAAWVLAQRERTRASLRAITASSRLPFWFLAALPAEGAAAGAVTGTQLSATVGGPILLAGLATVLALVGLVWVGLAVRPPFRAWAPAILSGRQLAGVRHRLVDVLHRAAVLAEADVPVPEALRRAHAAVDCSGARSAATAVASGDARPAHERAEELARLQSWTAERLGGRSDAARRLGDVAGQLNDDEVTETIAGMARLPFVLLAPLVFCLLPSAGLFFALLS